VHLLHPFRVETTKKRKRMSDTNSHYYTAYVVRSWNRRFLNQRTYTGRTQNRWGPISDSFIFRSVKRAQMCASSINKRPKDRVDADLQNAHVVPILLPRRNPCRAA
jgi:hypothetical protein